MTRVPQPNTRSFAIRSRGLLIAATVALQALVIGAGAIFTQLITSSGLSDRLHDALTTENSRVVDRVCAQLDALSAGPLTFGTEEWVRAQKLVESQPLPIGAALFLLDADDRVLCHGGLSRNANLRRMDYAEQQVRLLPSQETWEIGNLNPGVTLAAEAEMVSGPTVLALRYDAAREVKVVMMQPHAAMAAAGERLTEGLWVVGLLGSALVLMISTAGQFALVHRYDTVLSRANRELEAEVERRTRRGLAIRNGLIFGLAKLADYRDTDTGRHLERICRYCEILARELRREFPEIDDPWIDLLKLASSMHDIGKVGIPDSILLKPASLTDAERRQMQTHTLIGSDTLIAIRKRVGDDELINMGVQVALEHHERYDGTGYPYGLRGDEIALSARVVALADMYDALTSKRVYKAAMSHEEARRIILQARGGHFDPRVVDAFDRAAGAFDRARAELAPPPDSAVVGRIAA
ncbi:MAG: HD-GYP domain-containing protein [Phycisphaerales bacterium]